jgi:hypothetical protein
MAPKPVVHAILAFSVRTFCRVTKDECKGVQQLRVQATRQGVDYDDVVAYGIIWNANHTDDV